MMNRADEVVASSPVSLKSHKEVEPEDAIATTKEEEWVTKKKIELTTTRQVETRVKRQVVLEDGKVVEDSGPMITTNTTEDTKKQEHSQTEHRTLGDDDDQENWVAVSNPSGRVKEIQEKTVRSREETEERTETENVQHLGDISDDGYMAAITSGCDDIRKALEVPNKTELTEMPKILHQSMKSKKFIDTEDKTKLSQIEPGGKIINETRTTRLHEEIDNCDISDDDEKNRENILESFKRENFEKYRKTKDQKLTTYMANGEKIGEKLQYQGETLEGERHGDSLNADDEVNISSRLKQIRMQSQNIRSGLENESNGRGNRNLKKCSTFDREEESRKEETSKWLEHHFGSESTKSSNGSAEDLQGLAPQTQSSFINVTMKSQPLKNHTDQHFNVIEESVMARNRSPANENGYFNHRNRVDLDERITRREEEEFLEPSTQMRGIRNSPPVIRSYRPLRSKFAPSFTEFDEPPSSEIDIEDHGVLISEPLRTNDFFVEKRFQSVSPDISNSRMFSRTEIATHDFPSNRSYSSSPRPMNFRHKSDQDRLSPSFESQNISARREKTFGAETRDAIRKANDPFPSSNDKQSAAGLQISRDNDSAVPYKKLYQRTRFAADIPLPDQDKHFPTKQKSKIGESFRKFVGKLRSSSVDRKNKKRLRNHGSRSPSPKENTYQNYNSLDNYGETEENFQEPIAPPRTKYNTRSQSSGEKEGLMQRYYLGEDPFSASIYGHEKEYGTNSSFNKSAKETTCDNMDEDSQFKIRTLGRFSKSTNRMVHPQAEGESYLCDRRVSQTLPRKLRDEKINNNLLYSKKVPEPSFLSNRKNEKNAVVREIMVDKSGATNVSHIYPTSSSSAKNLNTWDDEKFRGPAKPARTYRSNLSRSQSFNLQPVCANFRKLNSHLHNLEESPPPLESPSMISRWSQSSIFLNGENAKIPESKDTRRVFLKGLYNRAPELFKTLHGNNLDELGTAPPVTECAWTKDGKYSNDRHDKPNIMRTIKMPLRVETHLDGNMIQTISRSESSGNDDYSETVRIESKSDDPLHPTETNTVKIFSKKKIPSKNGHTLETIESRETKTITKKSQPLRDELDSFRSSYNSSPASIVIKVRNTNY